MDARVGNGVKLTVHVEDGDSSALRYNRCTFAWIDIVGLGNSYRFWHGAHTETSVRFTVPIGPQGDLRFVSELIQGG